MPTLQFAPLWRPLKINWRYPHVDRSAILDTIKSKRARKFLRAHQEVITQYQLTITTDICTIETYQQFQNFYISQFSQKSFDLFATDQWFSDRLAENKQVHFFFIFQNSKLVAAKIFTLKEGVYRSAFKVSEANFFGDHHMSNASLGLLIDYLWLDHIMQESPRLITGGSSRNLFGQINTIGYLIYKLRLGYFATLPTTDSSFATDFEQSTTISNNTAWLSFLCPQPKLGEMLQLYYGGDLEQSNQYQELLSMIEPLECHHI